MTATTATFTVISHIPGLGMAEHGCDTIELAQRTQQVISEDFPSGTSGIVGPDGCWCGPQLEW